ncbi:hypothetical protein SAMN05216526_1643 [Ectothiorhodosinus mongolicus]|uniref:DUF1425 domain-containing protein n=1 Tax=Ectothiorhodosinus mongolicus TaxID=233100 RepID=A0A1R3W486_9GAMM|nr:hypothetical protein [Ectothiorhodosinus mongolicus]ULX57480.1 hypothetical protein CKX93_07240 [Ectothiorhodosinus mongolicus]SIT72408.1 hypothetical protein SAMN05216526_1643 [Ectothiorhodosinus mongolicus]
MFAIFNRHGNQSGVVPPFQLIFISFALLSALFLTACMPPPMDDRPFWYDRVAVADNVRSLELLDVRENYAPDGTPMVVLVARSGAVSRQNLRARALWFDGNGTPIRTTVSNWQQRTIDRGQQFEMTFVGPGSMARSYRIEVQRNPN